MQKSMACQLACDLGYDGCEAKQFISSTDCNASRGRCMRDCAATLANPMFKAACGAAVGGAMDLAVKSCASGAAPAGLCATFCSTTDALIFAAVVAAGAGPEDPLADAAAAIVTPEYAVGCEAACVGTLSAACSSVGAVGQKVAVATATTAFCAKVLT